MKIGKIKDIPSDSFLMCRKDNKSCRKAGKNIGISLLFLNNHQNKKRIKMREFRKVTIIMGKILNYLSDEGE